ncbi:MAG: 7TM diverse intracellular signaling domain-containing protein [Cytophagales bacterium]|nr:7TM diverse intracellular signaling domain-containing protein [Cytophagales bacterium]
MINRLIIIISIVFFSCTLSRAQWSVFPLQSLSQDAYYVKDTANIISTDNIISKAAYFKQNRANIFMLDEKATTYWITFKFDITNISEPAFFYDASNFYHISHYIQSGDTLISLAPYIQKLPYLSAAIINISSFKYIGKSTKIYSKIVLLRDVMIPIKGGEYMDCLRYQLLSFFFDALFFGIFFIIFLYNVFMYVTFRQRYFLFYISYIFFTAIYMIYWKGYTQLLPSPWHIMIVNNTSIINTLNAFSIALFIITFFNIHSQFPKMFLTIVVFHVPFILKFVLDTLGYTKYTNILFEITVMANGINFLWVTLYLYIKGNRNAIYSFIGWAGFIASIFVIIFTARGVLPYTLLTKHLIPLATVVETILFSVAIGLRINEYRNEKQLELEKSLYEKEMLIEELTQKEELLTANEEELTSREEELRQSFEEISATNDELIKINQYILEKEKQITAIVDNTTDLILSIDNNYKVTFANKAAKDAYVLFSSHEFMIGDTVFNYIDEKYHDFYKDTYAQVFAGEYVYQVTENIEKLAGKYISEEFYSPIKNENNVITGIAIFIRDVTMRENAEAKLREQDRVYSAIINSTDEYILALDQDLQIIAYNNNYANVIKTLFNIELEPGKYSALALLPPELKDEYAIIFEKVLRGERHIRNFARLNRENMPDRYTQENFNPIYDDNGSIKGIAVFADDITKEVQANMKLVESENMLKMAQQVAKIGSWIYNIEKNEIKWSDQMYEIFGIDPAYKLNIETYFALLPAQVQTQNKQLVERCLSAKESYVLEYKYKTPKGETKYLRGIGMPKINDTGSVWQIYGSVQDVTEIKLVEIQMQTQTEELIDSNRKAAEYRLIALRSVMNPHFLFNSLNSIQYYIAKNEKENALNYLSTFSKLIRSILNSSLQNTNTLATELEILKLYIGLESLRFDQKFKTTIHVDTNIDAENTEIPSLLLQPYVENAILHGLYNKKNDTNGHLKIDFRKHKNKLLCIVQDNGIGREEAMKIRQSGLSHKSVGMIVTKERLELINKNNNLSVQITDLKDDKDKPCGTKVEVSIIIQT